MFINAKDPNENDISIFLDFTGFMADYPASFPLVDARSCNADCQCTFRFFKRRRNFFGSNYSYKTAINGKSSTYIETSLKTTSISNSKQGIALFLDVLIIYLYRRQIWHVHRFSYWFGSWLDGTGQICDWGILSSSFFQFSLYLGRWTPQF